MDISELFRQAELLRERNRELREAVATSVEQLKAAEMELPNYTLIKAETDRFPESRANVCEPE